MKITMTKGGDYDRVKALDAPANGNLTSDARIYTQAQVDALVKKETERCGSVASALATTLMRLDTKGGASGSEGSSYDRARYQGVQVTAAEAAKACMEVVDGITYWDDTARRIVEREFKEIISQVTPPPTLEQEMAWMAHQKQKNLAMWQGNQARNIQPQQGQSATCSRCGLDGTNWDHQYGCPHPYTAALIDPPERLTYEFVTRSGKHVPTSSDPECFHQEIEEPRSPSLWEKIKEKLHAW